MIKILNKLSNLIIRFELTLTFTEILKIINIISIYNTILEKCLIVIKKKNLTLPLLLKNILVIFF